jgi:hypothetical protein
MSITELPIQIDREKIAEFCRARAIRTLGLFGSMLREDFDPAASRCRTAHLVAEVVASLRICVFAFV